MTTESRLILSAAFFVIVNVVSRQLPTRGHLDPGLAKCKTDGTSENPIRPSPQSLVDLWLERWRVRWPERKFEPY